MAPRQGLASPSRGRSGTLTNVNVPSAVASNAFGSDSLIPDEFEVILLAGQGKGLYPLSGDDNLPKALLPIGNRPMIAHILEWVERARLRSVTIVSNAFSAEKITYYLRNVYEGEVMAQVRIYEGEGVVTGTAEVLRSLASDITRDFIVLSCDTITDLPPHSLLDFHRLHDSTLTAVIYDSSKVEGGLHGTKDERDDQEEGEVVGIHKAENQLVYIKSRGEMGDLQLRLSLLNQFPNISISTLIQDAHIYVFKRWVLDFVVAHPKITSIKEDLVPLLVKLQYRKGLAQKYDLATYATTRAFQQMALEASSTQTKTSESLVTVRAFTYASGYCTRANTVPRYAAINRHISKVTTLHRVAHTAQVSPKSQVGTDSLIGESCRVDEKSSIKKSTVGAHCTIGKFVKISNCIVMDHVTIADGVKLEGCVLCVGSKVDEKASLKDCEVGPKFVVEAGREAEGEQLTVEIDFAE